MEEILVIAALGAFFAAALTVPAGFGLSTMLTPFALLLMPPHEAVAVVAVYMEHTTPQNAGVCGIR